MLWQAATSETDRRQAGAGARRGLRLLRRRSGPLPARVMGHETGPKSGIGHLPVGGRPGRLSSKRRCSPEITQKVASAHSEVQATVPGELKWLVKVREAVQAAGVHDLARPADHAAGSGRSPGDRRGLFRDGEDSTTTYTPIEDTVYSAQYRDLARLPLLDRNDLINAAPPDSLVVARTRRCRRWNWGTPAGPSDWRRA